MFFEYWTSIKLSFSNAHSSQKSSSWLLEYKTLEEDTFIFVWHDRNLEYWWGRCQIYFLFSSFSSCNRCHYKVVWNGVLINCEFHINFETIKTNALLNEGVINLCIIEEGGLFRVRVAMVIIRKIVIISKNGIFLMIFLQKSDHLSPISTCKHFILRNSFLVKLNLTLSYDYVHALEIWNAWHWRFFSGYAL